MFRHGDARQPGDPTPPTTPYLPPAKAEGLRITAACMNPCQKKHFILSIEKYPRELVRNVAFPHPSLSFAAMISKSRGKESTGLDASS